MPKSYVDPRFKLTPEMREEAIRLNAPDNARIAKSMREQRRRKLTKPMQPLPPADLEEPPVDGPLQPLDWRDPRDAQRAEIKRRIDLLRLMEERPELREVEIELCRRNVERFFDNWVWTFDPRLVLEKSGDEARQAHVPMILFPRQRQLIQFFCGMLETRRENLVEKSRDIGFTWIAGGTALNKWLFRRGFKTAFGSRTEDEVDLSGELDSIFEKMRYMLRALPWWMQPRGFDWKKHSHHMRLFNPENENSIRGDAGKNMGRGGRVSWYLIDEAAHIEEADSVDGATSATSEVRTWGSSVNGPGNLFFRKRFGGALGDDQIFIFDWHDDPRKDDAWEAKKRAELEPHIFAAEYDRDYSASVEGICIPAIWVQACQRIAKLMNVRPGPEGIGGLDVGGGGKGKSVYLARFGPVVTVPVSWGEPDTTGTAHKGLKLASEHKIVRPDGTAATVRRLNYDCIGIGKGVQSILENHPQVLIRTMPINVGDAPSEHVIWPDKKTSAEKFVNMKAEAWHLTRERAKATYLTVLALEGKPEGRQHPPDELLVLPPNTAGPTAMALASQLSLPRWFTNEKGKVIMETKQQLARRGIASPDYAEALVLTFCDAHLPAPTRQTRINIMAR